MITDVDRLIPSGYTPVRPINEGRFDLILEIKETSTGKSYALKLIPRLTEADRKRGEREVSLLERFRHARIVGLHESMAMKTYHSIVMELGRWNLKDLMTDFESRKELIPLEVAVQILIDIAEGLCVMHTHTTHPMAHGDLKPENVLLTDDNRAMLCDFGAAEASGMNTSQSVQDVEPSEYSLLERLNDKTHRGTPESDIWSLGVIVHRMVTGRPLFVGESLSKMIQTISKFKTSKIPTSLAPAVRTVLVRLLDPNAESRPTSTELFKERLLERMLGPETPLSKMQNNQLQDLKKELARLKEENKTLQAANAEYRKLVESLNSKQVDTIPPNNMNPPSGRFEDGGDDDQMDEGTLHTPETPSNLKEEIDKLSQSIPNLQELQSEDQETQMWVVEQEKLHLDDLSTRIGTESLQTLDRSAHTLTPTTLTQFAKLGKTNDWRTAFTVPIDEGEWELKIRYTERSVLGFLRHPLPENATQTLCGGYLGGIGGHSILWDGRMWTGGKEFKPNGTNKRCDRVGQTAAIRVNMRTREARLFVDDEEQPGIFPDIPSLLCLAITTRYQNQSIEVLWLKRLRENDELERAALEERRPLKSELEESNNQLADVQILDETASLQTLDQTAPTLTPTTLTQFIKLEKRWTTAFTTPIDEGEWELKINKNHDNFRFLSLGFLRHPLPEDATQHSCGWHDKGMSGGFDLDDGSMWKSGDDFKPEGTNKIWERVSQTAAIRVNVTTREARLFVDDEEQPGIFTDIPSPLCLGISTDSYLENQSLEVLWLKRLRGNDELVRDALEERRTLKSENEDLKLQMTDLPIWVGTESLQTLDRTAHSLTPTTLTQILKFTNNECRTAFTLPIEEGEWELKIRDREHIPWDVMLGFLKHPLPDDATQTHCGLHDSGIGGDFFLGDGSMWKEGDEFKPEGTNESGGWSTKTAAIRVNMWTREARLFVDDEEQPGIFTDIPSPLCLGITTGFIVDNQSVEVMWLKRLRGNEELERAALDERRSLKSDVYEETLQLAHLPIWVGTDSLQTFDRTVHALTPTTLTQIKEVEDDWRTAFTGPINDGEWELKIRYTEQSGKKLRVFYPLLILSVLSFIRHPHPEDATQNLCGGWPYGFGGDFILWDGGMWRSAKEFKPVGTNKSCEEIGQTSAIRVNMRNREARLFVDDEEQPGIFPDIPSPLCLGISTGFTVANQSVEVLWLKRLRGNDELELSLKTRNEEKKKAEADKEKMEEEKRKREAENQQLRLVLDEKKRQLADLPIWVGTESLQTLDGAVHSLTPTTLTQIKQLADGWRTAFTHPIIEGEWELEIKASETSFLAVDLVFLRHPLPEDATQFAYGWNENEIGGRFNLWKGRMWKEGKEFKPEGTNKPCDRIGQTSAIRVNMRNREARLFVDDEEQPGIFTDIPSPLCLGIATGSTLDEKSVEVLWLKRLRGNEELERSVLMESRTLKSGFDILKLQLADLPIWVGTESLQTLDRTAHSLTPNTLTQIIKLKKGWRTAFTVPIVEGEWELKIRAIENSFFSVGMFIPILIFLALGFLRHPLPKEATHFQCGQWNDRNGGEFNLLDGRMLKTNREVNPEGTNKKWERVGQTAAIRVNMRTKEARLVVDNSEQPGIFNDIPSPLCLGITTGFDVASQSVEVLWLKRLRGNDELGLSHKTRNEEKTRAEADRAKMEKEKKKAEAERAKMEEEKKKAEADRVKMEEEKKKAEAEREKMEEEKKKAEAERAKMEEEKKKAEAERAKMEEEKKKAEAERAKMEEEKKKAEAERAKMEEEKKKAEADRVKMEEEKKKAEAERAKMEEEKKKAEADRMKMEEEKKKAEADRMKMEEEKKNIEADRCRVRKENIQLLQQTETLKRQLANLPIWVGTESLQTLDRTVHALTPTTLTQVIKLDSGGWRTAFTLPIVDGEWEFKIGGKQNTFWNVSIGYVKHPLPENATQNTCGYHRNGIGGDFILVDGRMWRSNEEVKPAGTNRTIDCIGHTAAIRVNMRTREARLFVDDEEQPGIFTNIPSSLCLGISTRFLYAHQYLDIIWLKRLRS
ncbi:putative Carbon catabolite-derepressing protein kinase [Blattamonas nauphoetae]|uniref:non-specific serine/threonine protein kinase n=1 Tax=Blattamonas nauphoetae TaxID=2049346 RepID=A0ABQ9XDQ2_9EUKA|nr:putative Carbon catabolite-derepressing protein kinase [Blattamonas nauphoetae]